MGGRCFTTSDRSGTKTERNPKGDAVCIEGMPEGMLAVLTHSFSAILLSCSGPYQKFMQNEADLVKCK